jgi:cell fate regulator YaaT (PSP1 superfamily)
MTDQAAQTEMDFSEAPISITEARAKKESSAAKWMPRDALIYALREIDAGKLAMDSIVIAYTSDADNYGFINATKSRRETVGLLEMVKARLVESDD